MQIFMTKTTQENTQEQLIAALKINDDSFDMNHEDENGFNVFKETIELELTQQLAENDAMIDPYAFINSLNLHNRVLKGPKVLTYHVAEEREPITYFEIQATNDDYADYDTYDQNPSAMVTTTLNEFDHTDFSELELNHPETIKPLLEAMVDQPIHMCEFRLEDKSITVTKYAEEHSEIITINIYILNDIFTQIVTNQFAKNAGEKVVNKGKEYLELTQNKLNELKIPEKIKNVRTIIGDRESFKQYMDTIIQKASEVKDKVNEINEINEINVDLPVKEIPIDFKTFDEKANLPVFATIKETQSIVDKETQETKHTSVITYKIYNQEKIMEKLQEIVFNDVEELTPKQAEKLLELLSGNPLAFKEEKEDVDVLTLFEFQLMI